MSAHPGPAPAPAEDEVLGKAYDARLARRMIPYVTPQARWIALSVALMFAAMGAQLLQPWLVKRLFDVLIPAGDRSGIVALGLVYLGAIAVELLARYGQLLSMELTGQNVILHLRHRLFSHLLTLDAAFFDRHPVGRLMTRVTTDIEALADLFSSGVVSLLGDSVKLLAIVGILWWLNWRLACVTFALTPFLFLLSYALRGRIRRAYRDVRRRIARINAWLQEAITGMLLSQLFRREGADRRDFEAINREHRDAELRSVVYESAFSAVIELVGNVAIALIVWYGGGEMVRGALTFGTLVAFLNYTGRFFGPIQDLSGFWAVLQAAMASLERIFALLDERPAIVSPAVAATGSAPPARAIGRIVFDDVRFSYRPGVEVLHGITFAVEPGTTLAIVGATGSGKSTIIKLLVRLYDPDSGAVRLDGRDLRALPLDDVRRQIGVVQQDHFLFTGTIASNIGFGRPDLGRDRLEEAARRVHADPFVRRLRAGYDEPVRERGGNLSVGQKQLLSFARALAYDSAVLVLDEATSSVDSETEARIQDALRLLLRGRTSIVVAHRLSTIVGADRILVLHHGRVAETGTHRALLARGGIYQRLYALQFQAGAEASAGSDGTDDPAARPESVPEIAAEVDPIP